MKLTLLGSAMRQFNTSDPMWYVLRQLFDESAEPTANVSSPTHLCALCRTVCGRTIRQCAEMHGGRKVLKDEIKRLEAARQGGDLDEDQFAIVKDNVAELYDTYLKVGHRHCYFARLLTICKVAAIPRLIFSANEILDETIRAYRLQRVVSTLYHIVQVCHL